MLTSRLPERARKTLMLAHTLLRSSIYPMRLPA